MNSSRSYEVEAWRLVILIKISNSANSFNSTDSPHHRHLSQAVKFWKSRSRLMTVLPVSRVQMIIAHDWILRNRTLTLAFFWDTSRFMESEWFSRVRPSNGKPVSIANDDSTSDSDTTSMIVTRFCNTHMVILVLLLVLSSRPQRQWRDGLVLFGLDVLLLTFFPRQVRGDPNYMRRHLNKI